MTVMYESAYRACPICRNKLTLTKEKFKNAGQQWDIYHCPNCGSEIWIVPFKRIRERARKGR